MRGGESMTCSEDGQGHYHAQHHPHAEAGLPKHGNLPQTLMPPFEPSYSVCRKQFEILTINSQID